jgi:hypothetical protein
MKGMRMSKNQKNTFGGSVNTTSIAQGNGSFSRGQGKPTPQAGASVAAPPIKLPTCKPTVSKTSPR